MGPPKKKKKKKKKGGGKPNESSCLPGTSPTSAMALWPPQKSFVLPSKRLLICNPVPGRRLVCAELNAGGRVAVQCVCACGVCVKWVCLSVCMVVLCVCVVCVVCACVCRGACVAGPSDERARGMARSWRGERVRAYVCVWCVLCVLCVCERERERERETECMCVCVCVCVKRGTKVAWAERRAARGVVRSMCVTRRLSALARNVCVRVRVCVGRHPDAALPAAARRLRAPGREPGQRVLLRPGARRLPALRRLQLLVKRPQQTSHANRFRSIDVTAAPLTGRS
ncbi:Protein of unknown function [Gryllus bimaculatus]|nr:Protein of unknown function [Gryllus bimaculatus]